MVASALAGAAVAQQPAHRGGASSASHTSSHTDRIIQDERVRESSGLARSTYDRHILFTHNDSGDGPRVFAVDKQGNTVGVLSLEGAKSRDWEDISTGPGHSLWVGDIGDNRRKRSNITVYRFDEPQELSDKSVPSVKYDFAYEDGAHNAEALMVNPVTGRVLVATKDRRGAGIYRAPEKLSTTQTNTLTRIGTTTAKSVTAGAFFPDGKSFVLRNHPWAFVYEGVGQEPRKVRMPDQRQPESLDVSAAGGSFLVGSEGKQSPVNRVVFDPDAEESNEPPPRPNDGPPPPPEDPTPPPPNDNGDSDTAPLGWSLDAPATPASGTVKPESFGAVGDGKHDDSAALQQALDAAADSDKKVLLSGDHTYLSKRALTVPSKSYVYGEGAGSVLKFTWTENDSKHDGFYLGNEDQKNGNTDITFDNFAIEGAASGKPGGPKSMREAPRVPAIRLRLVDRFEVTNLNVSYAPGMSVLYQGCSNGRLSGNTVHHSGRDGITGNWHKKNMHEILVENNKISKIGDDGIAVIGASGQTPNNKAIPYNIVVRNNEIHGWPENPNGLQIGRGIALQALTKVVVSNNLVERTHSDGILLAGSTRSFSKDPKTGERWRSSDIDIVGNRVVDAGQNYKGSHKDIREPGHNGITVKASDNVTLRENDVTNSYGKDVWFGRDCKKCKSD